MIFEELYTHLSDSIGKKEKVQIIGVTGNMGAGKSHFCREFASFFNSCDVYAVHWDQDWYQVSRTERDRIITQLRSQNITDPIELSRRTYFDTYLWDEMCAHITLMKRRESILASTVYNKGTGNRDLNVELSFPEQNKPTWIVYDGGFIMHEPIRSLMDCMIVVEANADNRFERMAKRALNLARPYKLEPARFKELDTFTSWYLEKYRAPTDIILANDNFTHPKILFPK